jgi:Family of unknown function (DUF6424)
VPNTKGAVRRAGRKTGRRSPKAMVKPSSAVKTRKRAAKSDVSIEHQIKVGQTLVENIEGHAARTDSPEFVAARRTLHKIIGSLKPNPFGSGPIQAHHGGSIWLHAGAGDNDWHLVLNWAGIEWSAQFCCDPAKVDGLRRNALAITNGFPNTIPALEALGYTDTALLTTEIKNPADVARYVDSIWNSCVPIPQPRHTGSIKGSDALACGVHNYPEPMCGIPRVMRSDFVPFVVDPTTKTAAVVAPVAPRHSGDGRVRVLFAERGNPLHALHQRAHRQGAALVLSPRSRVAKKAFAKQQ